MLALTRSPGQKSNFDLDKRQLSITSDWSHLPHGNRVTTCCHGDGVLMDEVEPCWGDRRGLVIGEAISYLITDCLKGVAPLQVSLSNSKWLPDILAPSRDT